MADLPDIPVSDSTAPLPVKPAVSRYEFGDGYTQRVKNGLNSTPEGQNVVWELLTLAEKDTLVAFLKQHAGVTAFTWIPPGETVARQYTCGEWKFWYKSGWWYGTATFTEEFDL